MITTSGYNIEGYEIVEYVGHISAQTVLGTGFLSSLNASFADFFGESSSAYESKLYSAEQNAKHKLIERARMMGGNAVIGIDVDYTTFTNDILGVIVSGTVVVIKKIERLQESESRSLPSTLYNLSMPLRCTDCHILHMRKEKANYIKISGVVYGGKELKGICVAVKIKTMFNDTVEIPEIMFADINTQTTGWFSTEYVEIDLDSRILKASQSAECHIRKYIIDGNVIDAESVGNISYSFNEDMSNLRMKYGRDAVCYMEKTDSKWICVCGKENDRNITKCGLCGREPNLSFVKKVGDENINREVFVLSEHYDSLIECVSALNIKGYLSLLTCKDEIFINKVMPKVEEAVRLEKQRGNTKDILIKQLEKIYE